MKKLLLILLGFCAPVIAQRTPVRVNGVVVDNLNITNSSIAIWSVTGTNATVYPTNLANAQILNAAAIARSKIAAGTASHVVINDGSGNLSSEATLAKSRGGAGADMSSVTFPSSGTIATTSDLSSGYQPLDSDLTALAGNSSNGLWARTAAGTGSARTLTAGTGISISNGDGVSGNPTITATGSGSGDFSGPASSTNNNLVSFNGTGGKTGKDSGILTDGSGNITSGGTAKFGSATNTAVVAIGKPDANFKWMTLDSPWVTDSSYNAPWTFAGFWNTNSYGDPQIDIVNIFGYNVNGSGAQVKTNMGAFSYNYESNWQNLTNFAQSEWYLAYQYPTSNGTNLAVRPFSLNFQRNTPGNTNYDTEAVFNVNGVTLFDVNQTAPAPLVFVPTADDMVINMRGLFNLRSSTNHGAQISLAGGNSFTPTLTIKNPSNSRAMNWTHASSEMQVTVDGGNQPIHFYNMVTRVQFDQPIVYLQPLTIGGGATLTTIQTVYLINVDAQSVTLPTAVGATGKEYIVKTRTPAVTGTVNTTSSQLIDGASTYSLTASNKFVHVISDNTNWWVIANN